MQRLGTILVEGGLLEKGRMDEALAISRDAHKPLMAVLIDEHFVPEIDVLRALGEQYGLRVVDLKETPVQGNAVKAVPAKLASHYAVMPLSLEGGALTVAVSNPLDMSAVEDIETNLGYRVERVLACRDNVQEALRTHYGVGADTVERILSQSLSADEVVVGEESHDLEKLAADASVVRLVNQLLQEAIRDRATDIHLEVHRSGVKARRRIDGVLYDTHIPKDIRLLFPALVSRIKLMSGLNIVERRLPQDGRARVTIGRDDYDLRISIVPAIHGEDVVVRILPATMLFSLGQLGFSEVYLNVLQGLISRPHGILFVTGPTGSGKSTTLYACLSRLNASERKIITIEDPVEYELDGIIQTQINAKIGLTFARSLRSMLRHDPDVMLIGEVRDRETAEIAIQTAMTGHLVLSSLHTNDAAGGAVRLTDMGIDPYLITSTVLAFIAQRLVRVICSGCRESYVQEGRVLYRGNGCRKCSQTGYTGRVAIAEFLALTPEIQSAILDKASASIVRAKADALGMRTLIQDGEEKVAGGITTPEELLRVTSL